MMRLICNGEALDLRANTRLTFIKVNPLFAFDDITCERTTELDLPATPTNDRVFALAKDPAYIGEGMRRRYDAQMQLCAITKDGYLYVSKWSGESYKAIFVTGDLVGLKRLKEAGKLSDVLSTETWITWQTTSIPDLPAGASVTWNVTKYLQEGGPVRPSVLAYHLVTLAAQSLHFSSTMPMDVYRMANKLRLIPSKVKSLKSTDVVFARSIISEYFRSSQPPIPIINAVSLQPLDYLFGSYLFARAEYRVTSRESGTITMAGSIKEIMTRFALRITFPEDWPEDLYIGRFTGTPSPYIGGFSFLGDRSFDKTLVNAAPVVTRYGEPLAGRTVEIPRYTAFMIVSEADYVIYDANEEGEQGWKVQSDISAAMSVAGAADAVEGDAVRLQDNLPDITIVDLYKIFAAYTGTVINYTDKGVLELDLLQTDSWPSVDLTHQVVSISEVSRTFSDYAQRNIIRYTSGDGVPEEQRIEEVYAIDNDNIELEKELAVLPVSEGGEAMSEGYRVLSVAAVDGGPYILASTDTNATSMIRAQVRKNATITNLCKQSTRVIVRVRMSMYEYERLTPKTTILCKSVKYVWTESSWQDGIATLQLSKF